MQKKLKILEVCDNFFPNVDGVSVVIDNYCKTLMKNGHEVAVLTIMINKKYKDEFEYKVVRCNAVSLAFSNYKIAMPNGKTKKFIMDFKPDIIHVHSPFTLASYVIKIAKKMNIPVVGYFHTQYQLDFKEYIKSKKFATFMQKMVIRNYSNCHEVWTMSDSARKLFYELGFKGSCEVVPHGVQIPQPKNLTAAVKETKKSFNIKPDCNNLLYVGQIVWQKNLKLILDTLYVLKARAFNFKMYFVGGGAQKEDIIKYATELGLSDNVCFVNRILNREQISAFYKACDLFFFPSAYDTFGLVIREAACFGTPSLLLKNTLASDGFTDGENGFITVNNPEKTADKIMSLFEDKALLKKVGKTAQETIIKKWDEVYPIIEEGYYKVLENKKYEKTKIFQN